MAHPKCSLIIAKWRIIGILLSVKCFLRSERDVVKITLDDTGSHKYAIQAIGFYVTLYNYKWKMTIRIVL